MPAGAETQSSPTRVAESVHTRYDAELGWVNVPGASIPDLYGPGLDLRINAQGFRNDRSFDKEIPPGKTRIICSGDSFTLGYGVGQDGSWCAELEKRGGSFETVNMGQGGYGVDQSYLWFMRDAARMDFNTHVFTFIYTDFERMKIADFFGYTKPILKIENGRLAIIKPGQPKPRKELSRFTAFRIWIYRSPFVKWLELLARKTFLVIDDDETKAVLSEMFESLKQENQRKGSRLLVVYLPVRMDREKTRIDEFREFLKKELARQNIPFIDLTERFREMDKKTFDVQYLSAGDTSFAGAEGHYSAAGNSFVAGLILDELRKL